MGAAARYANHVATEETVVEAAVFHCGVHRLLLALSGAEGPLHLSGLLCLSALVCDPWLGLGPVRVGLRAAWQHVCLLGLLDRHRRFRSRGSCRALCCYRWPAAALVGYVRSRADGSRSFSPRDVDSSIYDVVNFGRLLRLAYYCGYLDAHLSPPNLPDCAASLAVREVLV